MLPLFQFPTAFKVSLKCFTVFPLSLSWPLLGADVSHRDCYFTATSLAGPRSLPPCECPVAPGVNILKCSSNHNSVLVVRGRGLLTPCREVHTPLLQSMPFQPACSFFGFLSFFFFHSFTCIFKSHRGIAYAPLH